MQGPHRSPSALLEVTLRQWLPWTWKTARPANT